MPLRKRKILNFPSTKLIKLRVFFDLQFRLEIYQNSYVFKTPGHATDHFHFNWCYELKSERQLGRLIRPFAICLIAVLAFSGGA